MPSRYSNSNCQLNILRFERFRSVINYSKRAVYSLNNSAAIDNYIIHKIFSPKIQEANNKHF